MDWYGHVLKKPRDAVRKGEMITISDMRRVEKDLKRL